MQPPPGPGTVRHLLQSRVPNSPGAGDQQPGRPPGHGARWLPADGRTAPVSALPRSASNNRPMAGSRRTVGCDIPRVREPARTALRERRPRKPAAAHAPTNRRRGRKNQSKLAIGREPDRADPRTRRGSRRSRQGLRQPARNGLDEPRGRRSAHRIRTQRPVRRLHVWRSCQPDRPGTRPGRRARNSPRAHDRTNDRPGITTLRPPPDHRPPRRWHLEHNRAGISALRPGSANHLPPPTRNRFKPDRHNRRWQHRLHERPLTSCAPEALIVRY